MPKKNTGIVIVKFLHPVRQDIPAKEVIVGNITISDLVTPEGEIQHEVKLTELVPAAINSSPMKADRHGRISRPGVTSKGTMPIGHVAQYTEGPLPSMLNFDRANSLTLVPTADRDDYEAELYYEPATSASAPTEPTSLTGAGGDRPNRAVVAESNKPREVGQKTPPHFCRFLREIVGVTAPLVQPTNVTAGQALDNIIEYHEYFIKFKPFSKKQGYIIPIHYEAPDSVTITDWQQYRNTTFTKNNITDSSTLVWAPTFNGDVGGRTMIIFAPWRPSTYDDMDFGSFNLLVTRELQDLDDEKPEQGPSSKKRKVVVVEDPEAAAEAERKRRKKEKKREKEKLAAEIKARKSAKASKSKALDSDDLDGSDGRA
ncbi:hypothetical protein MVEN_00016700 [Mycena venus]|uniref:Uncharacterized protein n=1 Tax=Mycena venus TaxID=2733690 RepID=A0A8H6Z685_9AGAR|nr:hypothetical protein MVEN_00016700 [Mycena venus]